MEAKSNPSLISYYTLRKAIGWLGITLPAVLIIGNALAGDCSIIQQSVSQYYHTVMRDVFVGILCAVALFLFSYKGYDRGDKISTSLAGLFALGVALSPTNYDLSGCELYHRPDNTLRNVIHLVSATLFFSTLAYIAVFRFTKSSGEMTEQKKIRNKIYIVCGIVIAAAIILIPVAYSIESISKLKPMFWLEWIALIAFGISWLVKGEFILKDS